MKKILLLACFLFMASGVSLAATPLAPLDPNIFELVQTTPRAQYYFNKAVITFKTDDEGNIDPNILIVPTVKILDNTEVEDITMKRQWKEENTYRFNELAATAEHLEINLTTDEIKFVQNDYLDRGYNPLHASYTKPDINLKDLGELNVNYNFYKTIIDYGLAHRREILKNMLKDDKKLAPNYLKEFNLLPNGDDMPQPKKGKNRRSQVKK